MKNNDIDYRFKFLYCVAIVMVVASHCNGGSLYFDIAKWFPVEGIQLGIFMFASGYLYKESSTKNITQYIWKKIKRLIIPMYIYNLVYGLLILILQNKGFTFGSKFNLFNFLAGPWLDGNMFVFNLGGWFIAPLFIILVLNVLIRKISFNKIPEWIYFLASITLGLLGTYLFTHDYKYGILLLITRTLYFIPFFSLGRFYKTNLETIDKKIPSFIYFVIIFTLQLLLIWKNNTAFTIGPAYFSSNLSNYSIFLPTISCFIGIAFWMRTANILVKITKKSKVINLIANNTYSIMMNQILGFTVVKSLYYFLNTKFGICSGFDVQAFKSDIFYYYYPRNIYYLGILYLLAGIFIPILIQIIINLIKKLWMKFYKSVFTSSTK